MDDAQEAAQMEDALAELCLEGLLGTGNGEQNTPFVLTLFSDQDDILVALSKQLASQKRVLHEGRWRNQVGCEDGSELWFDVHDLCLQAKSNETGGSNSNPPQQLSPM